MLAETLGKVGMGVVYLGVSWDRAPVAVKVLRPGLGGDEEFRRRLGREAAALVQVKGVCPGRVIEAASRSATPFVVTEYAPGPSLSEYIDKHGSVAPGMLFGLATGLAEALTTIHAVGIMHRDLKPSNIILTDGGPKVIDFGIARRQDTTAVTRTGMMIGSIGFMAPEQISGHPGPEADIFAWGVTVAYAAAARGPAGLPPRRVHPPPHPPPPPPPTPPPPTHPPPTRRPRCCRPARCHPPLCRPRLRPLPRLRLRRRCLSPAGWPRSPRRPW